ncbi:MerR family transcriptional regulator [Actinoplanes sp. DH11]|uniref:helix-turn-helix domain-containing protein n=1 Tax=Actinoplanes sp. DH11 TaxID=2857011 RepID=UPI001E3C3312|nr:MerR family transcriptional regulator [Actinoplanes sp. DH11]
MDDDIDLLTIGRLARRTGIDVRTLRFWSDEGAVPPAGRSVGGYRLYDAAGVARAELVRTLRELGFALDEVCRVLDGRTTMADVAETHVAALDARIRSLKVSRAVLSTVSKRGSTAEETALMNRLARLSAAERVQIIDDFKADVMGGLGLEPPLREKVRQLRIELPDDPTPEQVDAWVELAELIQDPDFRARMRVFLELNTPVPGRAKPAGSNIWWTRQVVEAVAEARQAGARPDGSVAAQLVADMFGTTALTAALASLEAGIEADADRYFRLVARVRGHRRAPDSTEHLHWLAAALRVAGAGATGRR